MSDDALQTAFNGIVLGRGELSSFHADIARLIAQLMIASKSMTVASELTALASDVSKLEALLPPISTGDAGEMMDLRRLTDAELRELERIQCKACDQASPLWEPDDPVAPLMGPAQLEGSRLGKWIDENCDSWTHRRLRADEELIVRNGFQGMARNFIARHAFRDIFFSEMQNQVEDAVKRALAVAGNSDAKVVPMNAQERSAALPMLDDGRPVEPERTNGGTSEWPAFSFANKPEIGDDNV